MAQARSLLPLGAGAAAALLAAFGLIAVAVTSGMTLHFDRGFLLALRQPGEPTVPIGPAWFEEAARDVTALGSASVLVIAIVVVVLYLFLSGKARTAWFLAFTVASGTVLSNALKGLFDRPRPDLTGITQVFTASFPSGHAMMSSVAFLTLGALLAQAAPDRRLRWFYIATALALTFVVGLSRLYLGVHYPTDVAAGWCLGGAWTLICLIGAQLSRERRPG